MKLVMIALLISAQGIACDEIFWGVVEYVDQNDQGQLLEKVELFQIREWSAQSQFTKLLIEKENIEQAPKSIALSKPQKISRVSLGLKEWPNNTDYFEVTGLNMSALEHLEEIAINYGLCQLKIPIKMEH